MNQSVIPIMLMIITGIESTALKINSFFNFLYAAFFRSSSGIISSAPAFAAGDSDINLYPASSTAAASCSQLVFDSSNERFTFSVARFTFTLETPSTFFNAFSTLATQLAHVIPSTGRFKFLVSILSPDYMPVLMIQVYNLHFLSHVQFLLL